MAGEAGEIDADTPFRLTDRVALVTGGTRGIGAAIARDFAAAGARVFLTGRNLDAAEAIASEIRDAGGDATALAYDAANAGASSQLIRELGSKTQRLDVLVNNAAILRPHTIRKLSEEEFDEIFSVNTKAALFLTKAALPLLEAADSACVINVTAAAAHHPMAGIGAYAASKAAMINFTATLALEWARYGIRVNALTPGSVATDMILPKDPDERRAFEADMSEQNLMQRLAEPIEIARAVRFLASPAASFITGQTLIADGGFLTR